MTYGPDCGNANDGGPTHLWTGLDQERFERGKKHPGPAGL